MGSRHHSLFAIQPQRTVMLTEMRSIAMILNMAPENEKPPSLLKREGGLSEAYASAKCVVLRLLLPKTLHAHRQDTGPEEQHGAGFWNPVPATATVIATTLRDFTKHCHAEQRT